MTNKIPRRDLLKMGLAGAGALVLSAGGIWHYQKPTLANRLLEEFPTNIHGAKEVKKYEIKGANKTLVHVRQAHINEGITSDQRDYVAKVQGDIYQILAFLNIHKKISEVYVEGLTENHEGDSNPDLSFYNIKTGEIIDAPKLLEVEGTIRLIPAERYESHLRALSRNAITKDIFDARENIALDVISRNQNTLNVLVYGGLHWFGDNINEWNKQHPDRKYSLIEITPESYREKK